MTKTPEQILTEACIELALLLTEQTSQMLTTENQGTRYRLKQAIAATQETYNYLLTRIAT